MSLLLLSHPLSPLHRKYLRLKTSHAGRPCPWSFIQPGSVFRTPELPLRDCGTCPGCIFLNYLDREVEDHGHFCGLLYIEWTGKKLGQCSLWNRPHFSFTSWLHVWAQLLLNQGGLRLSRCLHTQPLSAPCVRVLTMIFRTLELLSVIL